MSAPAAASPSASARPGSPRPHSSNAAREPRAAAVAARQAATERVVAGSLPVASTLRAPPSSSNSPP